MGILIEPVDVGVHIVATDGHRMVVIHDPNGVCEEPTIIEPRQILITECSKKKADNIASGGKKEDLIVAFLVVLVPT